MKSKDGSSHCTDEQFNTISHIIALILSILGGGYLIIRSSMYGDIWDILGACIYSASLVFLFSASVLHHGCNARKKIEKTFRTLDYTAVFALIGGTMTPCVLSLLRIPNGWLILGTIWLCAAAGICIRSIWIVPKWLTNTLYVGIGWLGLFLAILLYPIIPFSGILLFLVGGVIYTAGSVLYYLERPNPVPGRFGFHEIWHVMVVLAAGLHYAMIALYILP